VFAFDISLTSSFLQIKDEGILMNQKMGNTKISLSEVYDNAILEKWDTLQGMMMAIHSFV
jgi:hypothetical protein